MKPTIWALAALALLGAGRAGAAEIVVNFDDLVGAGQVPDGYGGINWGGHWDYYGFPQPPYNANSGANRVYTDYDTPVADQAGENTFSFQQPAVFEGAWFAGNAFADVQFNLYYHNALVFTSLDLAPGATPAFLASGYSGLVDEVGVLSQDNDYFVMDDVTFQSVQSAGAPEPAGLALVGVGAAGLLGGAWLRRRVPRFARPCF